MLHDPTAISLIGSSTKAAWAQDSWFAAVGVALSFLFGETLIPPYASRALASTTPAASRKSFVLAGIFCIFWLTSVSGIGLSAKSLGLEFHEGGVLIETANRVLPNGFVGLLAVAIVGILMSSQDSVLNAGAVAFTRDLAPGGLLKKVGEMKVGQLATVAIAITGAISAGWLPEIIDALLLIYSIWAPTVLVPLVFGLFMEKPGRAAGWLSMIVGGGTSILWQTVLGSPWGVPAILVGLMAASGGFFVGHALSNPSLETTNLAQ